jgi:hypothetical protein
MGMKDIGDVVVRMNKVLESTPLAEFYERRYRLNGGRGRKGGLFQVTHGEGKPLSGYSFHWGGRSELQFNIGFEEGGFFRYGVAFSLEPDRNLPDPVSVLHPKILKFNAAVPGFPVLRGLHMWSYQDRQRSSDSDVGPIPSQLIRPGTFVFVGERVDVVANGVTPAVMNRAASVLASLLPLYEQVEGNTEPSAPYKVARLCWNTDYWQRPTGRSGKVGNDKAFEAEHGFGHEEWLFDHSRLIDDWKYGFIQALNHSHAKYAGQQLNLLLYTIDSKTKNRYWVGAIHGAKALTPAEAAVSRNKFQKSGWIKEMQKQVEAQGLDGSSLSVAKAVELVNLRYKPESLTLFQPPIPFPADELPSAYYGTLQNVPPSQLGVTEGASGAAQLAERNIKVLKTTRSGYLLDKEIDLVHKRWQKELGISLRQELPRATIHVEVTMFGHQIDLVVDQGGKRVFIELKTKSIVRQVIRDALAQLMEYSYWPPSERRADVLLIVGAGAATAVDLEYLALLRERFNIPVHYRQYRNGSIEGIVELVESVVT